MSQTPAPHLHPTPSQPEPASMAASSQYHRGAAAHLAHHAHHTHHAHHHSLSADHDPLYANLATSWNGRHSFARPHAPQPPLQRFASSAQRAFAPHYHLDYSRPSDYVDHHASDQPAWPPASYPRPAATHEWSESLGDANYAPRPLPYADVEERAPVPHANPPSTLHHQNAPDAANQHNHPPDHHHHHLSSDDAAIPNAPPFPTEASNLAPVARLLNYPNPGLHVGSPHVSLQAPMSWPPGPSSEVSPVYPPHHSSHTGSTLSSAVVLSGQATLTSPVYGIFPQETTNAAAHVYEQVPNAPEWPPMESAPGSAGHVQQLVPAQSVPGAKPTSRGQRRAPLKKTLPKVTAAFVARAEKQKTSKRSGPLDEIKRIKTHQMRKNKTSCVRCVFYKNGCDDGPTCQSCLKVKGKARSFLLPCCRDHLKDASLVRHCNGRSSQEEGDFVGYEWDKTSQLCFLEITFNLPGIGPIPGARPMPFGVRLYHPKRPLLDTPRSTWSNTDGHVVGTEQPPYAIHDTASLLLFVDNYFTSLQPNIERHIFELVRHDPIASLTYNEVMRQRRKGSCLLDLAMRIQCLSFASQGYGTVSSTNVPGIREYDFRKLGRSTYEAYDRNSCDRPLPAAINHQMDVAMLKNMKKLENLTVKELSREMFKSKIKPWYEVFLALFVLSWNLEYIRRGAEKYIMSKNGTVIETQVSSVVSNQLKKWEWSHGVLTYHWQAVLRDFRPFKLARENPEELREKGHVDPEGFHYVMSMINMYDQIDIGRSTTPYVGIPPTHDSMSSEWIRTLFEKASI